MLAILYGAEAWGDLSFLDKELRTMEIKALKAMLKVKSGTTNDLVYNELERPCITEKIKDKQHTFFQKVMELSPDEAIVASILELCQDTSIVRYYSRLVEGNSTRDIEQREQRIQHSTNSM